MRSTILVLISHADKLPGQGEILGHDLMSPYIILRDQARTASISDSSDTATTKSKRLVNGAAKASDETLADFHSYVTNLLSRASDTSSPPSALLSPTTELPPHRRRSSFIEEPTSMKEAIDFAILRSNQLSSGPHSRSSTRFEIARSGLRVAVITLSRPAFRLGDTVHTSIDFSGAAIPTYAVSASLETSESVDGSLALRSVSSIARVTRKVYGSCAENVVFARKVGVQLGIPWSASPEMLTTGVGLKWKVRVEFVGPRLEVRRKSEAVGEEEVRDDGTEDDEDGEGSGNAATQKHQTEIKLDFPKLLEEASRDHRGAVWRPIERLQCDSFEVEVPIRVYGAVIESGEPANVETLVI